jgi:hypothetical protein
MAILHGLFEGNPNHFHRQIDAETRNILVFTRYFFQKPALAAPDIEDNVARFELCNREHGFIEIG